MSILISLDESLVNRIKVVIERYNNSNLPVEIVIGKFKGVFIRDIGEESYTKLFHYLKENSQYQYTSRDDILISNYTDNFDIDLTQYNIRLQLVKSHYIIKRNTGGSHEFSGRDYSIRMFKHPDGSHQVNISLKPDKYDINKIFKPLKLLFKPITKTNFLISYTERRQVTESYNFLLKKNGKNPIMIFNKPYNLTKDHIQYVFNPSSRYLVFPKLDGIRYLLYFIEGSSYFINYTEFMKISDEEDELLNNTLLDGEIVGDTFYSFDVIFWKGEDVRKLDRLDRLNLIKDANFTFKLSVILPEKDLQKGIDKFLNNPSTEIPLDGIVLAPDGEKYNNNKTYKYKPHTHQFIDFFVRKNIGPSIAPLNRTSPSRPFGARVGSADEFGRAPELPSVVHAERVRGGEFGPSIDDWVLKVKDYNGSLTPFKGSVKFPINQKHINLEKLNPEQIKILQDGEGGIIEFKWEDNTFLPIRHRSDKVNPNFIEVASIIWDEINDPLILFNILKSPGVILEKETGLFDSILFSGSEKYRSMSYEKKQCFLKSLRQNFSINLTPHEWLNFETNTYRKIIFLCIYQDFFIDYFIKIRETTLESKQLGNCIYNTIFSKYSLEYFTQNIIPKLVREYPKIIDFLEKEDEQTNRALNILLTEISKLSLNASYKKFIGRLSIGDHLDPDVLEYISILFRKDIYLLDSDKYQLFKSNRPYCYKGLSSIVIAFSSKGEGLYRYQSVGRLNSLGIPEYEFSEEDTLIRQIKSLP